MQGVFISYRRQDSQSAAGRLADDIKEIIVDVPVFRDVETIAPGVDFVEAINRALESCGVRRAARGDRAALADRCGCCRTTPSGQSRRLHAARTQPRRNWLRGGYASAVTGERGMVLMQRTP